MLCVRFVLNVKNAQYEQRTGSIKSKVILRGREFGGTRSKGPQGDSSTAQHPSPVYVVNSYYCDFQPPRRPGDIEEPRQT